MRGPQIKNKGCHRRAGGRVAAHEIFIDTDAVECIAAIYLPLTTTVAEILNRRNVMDYIRSHDRIPIFSY